MVEEAWRERFRQRVAEVDDLFVEAFELLVDNARIHLEAQMLVGDAAAAARARIQLAQGALEDASGKLASAMSLTVGAKLLVLRGGSHDPLMPYHDIGHLGDEYAAEKNACAKLRGAEREAEEACARIGMCSGHLETISLLLDHENLPGVNDLIENERLDAAVDDLLAAIGKVESGKKMANDARLDAWRARDRIQRVLGALGEASSDLAFAMSVMNGAKLLVFSDVIGIEQLGDQYFPEGNAGVVLHDSVEDVEEAFAMVDSCRSHLDAVLLLLDHPRLPGVDGLIQEELAAADGDLQAAIGNAELGTELAVGARQDVSGAN
uniref:Uncharacterized protein n=1 Tax=Oryza barthii TaxID=65489 RepID=A0A0D3EJT2_9ORYZ